MFLTSREMYAAEEAVFATGVPAEDLMNQAGGKIAREILRRFKTVPQNRAIAVIGKGNNGADALVALRHLKEAGWQVGLRASIDPSQLEGLPLIKWQELADVPLLSSLDQFHGQGSLVLLDGLVGIGTKGDLREPLAGLAREINAMGERRAAFIVAIDIPSGLNCETGLGGENTVKADLTCTLASPKIGLIRDHAISYVGALTLLKLEGLSNWDLSKDHLITPATLPVEKLTRPFDFHKGQAGRVGIIAGSRGLAGAAALTAQGALRGGAGLITLFVKKEDYPLILPLIPLEVMVKPITSYREVLSAQLDALAIGPGLGMAETDALSVITNFTGPIVIDADALNLIARRSSITTLRPEQLVTPHPGEIARLLPSRSEHMTRAEIAHEFVRQSQATLLFKGARTIVTDQNSPLAYNTTGTPAMATGGQGDVLSGLLVALLARGIPPLESAKFGAWLSGRASELALAVESEESLSATSTAAHLGAAFHSLRSAVT